MTSATAKGFSAAQLYSTASYQEHDLTGVNLANNDLRGWDFEGQFIKNATLTDVNLSGANLRNAQFYGTWIGGADLTGADVRGANFSRMYAETYIGWRGGITESQISSTASYESGDLTGI